MPRKVKYWPGWSTHMPVHSAAAGKPSRPRPRPSSSSPTHSHWWPQLVRNAWPIGLAPWIGAKSFIGRSQHIEPSALNMAKSVPPLLLPPMPRGLWPNWNVFSSRPSAVRHDSD